VTSNSAWRRNLPFFFIGAGLPQLAALAGNAKSYADRLFTYPQMGGTRTAFFRGVRCNLLAKGRSMIGGNESLR
jgi:hypothetical protein